jgi:energy-coupling factor transport system permease protein
MIEYVMANQASPTGSILQRLDPRTRLLGLLTFLILFITAGHYGVALLLLGGTLGLVLLARIPLRLPLQSLRMLLPWLVVIAALQLLLGVGSGPGCATVIEWGWFTVTACGMHTAALTLIRFVGLVLLTSLFVWIMPIPSLVQGLEGLASPFIRWGLPVHGLVLTGVIGVRFLPTMALDLERLRKAQRSRGAGLGQGRSGFVTRVRRTLPLIVPLFVMALERAERLAEAMEARGYTGGKGRSRRSATQLAFRRHDWAAFGLLVFLALAALWI